MQSETPKPRMTRREKKSRVQATEELAQVITELDHSRYSQLQMPEALREEIEIARATKGRGSRKRQTKFLAGVLKTEPEACAILAQRLDAMKLLHQQEQQVFHDLESMRDRLCELAQYDDAHAELAQMIGADDLRGIERLAQSVQQNRDLRAYREIFKRLKKLLRVHEGAAPLARRK